MIFHTIKVFVPRGVLVRRAYASNQLYLSLVLWLFNRSEGAVGGTMQGTEAVASEWVSEAQLHPSHNNPVLYKLIDAGPLALRNTVILEQTQTQPSTSCLLYLSLAVGLLQLLQMRCHFHLKVNFAAVLLAWREENKDSDGRYLWNRFNGDSYEEERFTSLLATSHKQTFW